MIQIEVDNMMVKETHHNTVKYEKPVSFSNLSDWNPQASAAAKAVCHTLTVLAVFRMRFVI